MLQCGLLLYRKLDFTRSVTVTGDQIVFTVAQKFWTEVNKYINNSNNNNNIMNMQEFHLASTNPFIGIR